MNRNNTMQNIQYVSAIHLGIQCLEERKDKADLGAAQDLRKLANEIIPGSGNMDVGKVKSQYHLPTDLMKEINKGGKRKHKKKKRKTKKNKRRHRNKTQRRKRRGGHDSPFDFL
jgi:hypothetical protein|tara:strand:+ start:11586 stop:11927 length:342 start_codon:yes stop_codon:yes gene_type:complete